MELSARYLPLVARTDIAKAHLDKVNDRLYSKIYRSSDAVLNYATILFFYHKVIGEEAYYKHEYVVGNDKGYRELYFAPGRKIRAD